MRNDEAGIAGNPCTIEKGRIKKRVLILGMTGMLGHMLFRKYAELPESYDVYGTVRTMNGWQQYFPSTTHQSVISDMDVRHFDAIVTMVEDIRPAVVINCIGVIKQLPSTNNPLVTIPVNALFPHQLAALCQTVGARMIHLSTDCVFSGRRGNYREEDIPDPIDLYGRSKLLGEVDAPHCLTLRTSIIGRELHSQSGLFEWFISQRNKRVKGYEYAIYTGFTTLAMVEIIRCIIDDFPELHGIWHVSSEPISKYALLNMVNDIFELGITIERDERVICDRSLDSSRFRHATGYTPPVWQDMIVRMKNENDKFLYS